MPNLKSLIDGISLLGHWIKMWGLNNNPTDCIKICASTDRGLYV